jgi:hypothetical protein
VQSEMGIAHALWIEECALGGYSQQVLGHPALIPMSEAAIDMYRVMSIGIRLSCRLAELLRMSITDVRHDKALVVTERKTRSVQSAPSVQQWIPSKGLMPGSEVWFPDFMEKYRSKKYIVRKLAPTPYNSNCLLSEYTAFAAEEKCAHKDQLSEVWLSIWQQSPWKLNSAQCSAVHLTNYAIRHLLPTVAIAQKIPVGDRCLLGGWKANACEATVNSNRGSSRALSTPMPDRYAGRVTQADCELHIRVHLLAIIREKVGDPSSWRSRFPVMHGAPSFDIWHEGDAAEAQTIVNVHDEVDSSSDTEE